MSKLTGRILKIYLYADSAADELILTAINDLFSQKHDKVSIIIEETKNGNTKVTTWSHDGSKI